MGCVAPQVRIFHEELGTVLRHGAHHSHTTTRCFRRLRGAVVGQVTGLSGRVRQERGSGMSCEEDDITLSSTLSHVSLAMYTSVDLNCCASEIRVPLSKDRQEPGDLYFPWFLCLFWAFIPLIALDLGLICGMGTLMRGNFVRIW